MSPIGHLKLPPLRVPLQILPLLVENTQTYHFLLNNDLFVYGLFHFYNQKILLLFSNYKSVTNQRFRLREVNNLFFNL